MAALENHLLSYFELSTTDIKKLAELFLPLQIKKGDFLLKTGKRCEQLSFIQSGLMRVFVPMDGNEITQWISTEGYFVTDLTSFFFQSPARWTIQAMTDVEIFTISRENYNQISSKIPQWPELEKLFLVKCFATMEDRIFTHLSMSAEERYQFFFEHHKELFNQVPLQYIASMLGMKPETFSRIRKKRQK